MGNTEQMFKDITMPDGDACRPDGTLKDADEMEWPNSPSEGNLPEPTQLSDDGYNLKKRSLLRDEELESNSESDGPPKTKVNYNLIVFAGPENLPKLWVSSKN